jgi:hypothetical protein
VAVLQIPDPTATQTEVDSVTLPETPLTVTVYKPLDVVVVVVVVSVVFCVPVVLKVIEVGERLHVTALVAPVGAATEQLSVTVPVNVLAGVTVMVEEPVPAVLAGMEMLVGLLERV